MSPRFSFPITAGSFATRVYSAASRSMLLMISFCSAATASWASYCANCTSSSTMLVLVSSLLFFMALSLSGLGLMLVVSLLVLVISLPLTIWALFGLPPRQTYPFVALGSDVGELLGLLRDEQALDFGLRDQRLAADVRHADVAPEDPGAHRILRHAEHGCDLARAVGQSFCGRVSLHHPSPFCGLPGRAGPFLGGQKKRRRSRTPTLPPNCSYPYV